MFKFILIIGLYTGAPAANVPASVTGKWLVEHVDIINMGKKVPPKGMDAISKALTQTYTNTSYVFRPDHHCITVANVKNKANPVENCWEYNTKTGLLRISDLKTHKMTITTIRVSSKGGKLIFGLQDSPVVLTVHKIG
jgi:hypothetical protein